MALYCTICKSYKTLLLPSYVLIRYIHKNLENRNVTLDTNAIDDFTTHLIQKQLSKWENLQAKSKELCKQQSNVNKIYKEGELGKNIPELWNEAVEQKSVKDVLNLMRFCVKNNTAPPKNIINLLADILADNAKSEAIIDLRGLCETHFPEVLRLNANFDIHLAEAYWNQGDMKKSLFLFSDAYKKNKTFRIEINTRLKYLFFNIIKNRGEAALLMVVKFCEDMHKNHQDVFLLCVVWQMCFLSEWFSDQNIAFDLMEKNNDLMKAVLLRIPFLVSLALNNHHTEIVHRLLEFLLKHNLKTEYSKVLQCLFDYKIRQRDIRGCCEIIRWSTENSVHLSGVQSERFMKMLPEIKAPLYKNKTHLKYSLKF